MPGLEPGIDQSPPDRRQLLDPRAEHVDPLPAGDLGVQAELARHLADGDQAVRRDLPARDPRHDGVAAVLLHVGQEVVVGVLQDGLLAVEDVSELLAGQHRRDGGLADVAAASGAVPLDDLAERRELAGAHGVEQLGAVHREVLAQRGAGRDAALGEQRLEQRNARPAAGARLRACLDGADVGQRVFVDRFTYRRLAQVVTRADLGIVRDFEIRPGRGDHCDRVGGQRPADQRAQRRVARRVADQDPAEQRLRGVVDDQLRVGALDRVAQRDLERSLGRREGIAEAGHVHAEQLELGGRVRARERCRSADEAVSGDLGHLVARPDQPVYPTADRRALADRVHVIVGGTARLVDDDAAAFGDVQAAVARELVTRPHAG